MNLTSRLQPIELADNRARGVRPRQVVRVVVENEMGTDVTRVVLSPRDLLIVENRTNRPLTVVPLDFFGNPFGLHRLDPGHSSPPLMVTGLWFQVDIHSEDHRNYQLDIYLAPNAWE
jgi:hypothetical protein